MSFPLTQLYNEEDIKRALDTLINKEDDADCELPDAKLFAKQLLAKDKNFYHPAGLVRKGVAVGGYQKLALLSYKTSIQYENLLKFYQSMMGGRRRRRTMKGRRKMRKTRRR